MPVDWETTTISALISAIFSAIVGFGIAFYVKKRMKPTHDRVYETNRQTNLRFIFNDYERFHDHATFIFDEFEKQFGELRRKRKELVTQMKFVPIEDIEKQKPVSFSDIVKDQKSMEDLRTRLKFNLEQMQQISKFYFSKDNINTLDNYFEHDFTLHVVQLFNHIIHYVEELFQTNIASYSLESALDRAQKIIDYLKSDRDLDLSEENVKSFIDRWEKAIRDLK